MAENTSQKKDNHIVSYHFTEPDYVSGEHTVANNEPGLEIVEAARYYPKALELVQTPYSMRKFVTALTATVVVIVLSLWLIPWQQTVAGSGKVTSFVPNARPQNIESPISGRIAGWRVVEGDYVRIGDTLAVLQDINTSFMDEEFVEKLEQFRDNSVQSQQAALEVARQRTLQAIQRGEAAEAGYENAKIESATARLRFNRTKELSDDGLASTRDLETAQLNLQKTQADSVRTLTALESARQEVAALKNEESRIRNLAQASISEIELRLGNARQRQRASVIISPIEGVITRIEKPGAGQVVKESEVLATIVPETKDQAAEIMVSSMDAAIIEVGRPVRLQFSGFPAMQFSGLPDFAIGTFGGRVKVIDAVDDGSGYYRVLVEPDTTRDGPWPDNRYLRQGAEVTGWVLLESVSLGYEVWRQINGFPPLIPTKRTLNGNQEKAGTAEKSEKK
ncbi:MAG TPA: HlyD family efflux transporter periplasmic adaptor subunit [Patescibacteria group bacterium]|nr:HlyD family efflux transporter periplasmic adaptor subunit [Patescibacteria group bacterium]